jgi:ribosomal-protein-alanine N-acetyltransferase
VPYIVERMQLSDIPEVERIERQSFSSPWSRHAYEHDLTDNRLAHYLVVRQVEEETQETIERKEAEEQKAVPASSSGWQRLLSSLRNALASLGLGARAQAPEAARPRPPIVGFAGMWLMADEAHLVTIAVPPSHRRHGLGKLLLLEMLELANRLGAQVMTLEVRVSNIGAQELYRKYGFTTQGLRKHYYSDNNEDALLMTTESLDSPAFRGRWQRLKLELQEKLGQAVPPAPE